MHIFVVLDTEFQNLILIDQLCEALAIHEIDELVVKLNLIVSQTKVVKVR